MENYSKSGELYITGSPNSVQRHYFRRTLLRDTAADLFGFYLMAGRLQRIDGRPIPITFSGDWTAVSPITGLGIVRHPMGTGQSVASSESHLYSDQIKAIKEKEWERMGGIAGMTILSLGHAYESCEKALKQTSIMDDWVLKSMAIYSQLTPVDLHRMTLEDASYLFTTKNKDITII